MASAASTARRHNAGASVASLLDHRTSGQRDRANLIKRGVQPKDHTKENWKRLRQQEAEQKAKKEEELEEQTRAVFKLREFEHVKSKVTMRLLEERENMTSSMSEDPGSSDRVPRHPYLKAKIRQDVVAAAPYKKRESRLPAVPTVQDMQPEPEREHKNLISKNIVKARERVAKKPDQPKKKTESLPGKQHRMGEVPHYLTERNRREAEEEAYMESLVDHVSNGMQIMPESERIETLQILKENQHELNRRLASMPLVPETLGQRKRRSEIEDRLVEVQDAIEIFSKPKVYVMDEGY